MKKIIYFLIGIIILNSCTATSDHLSTKVSVKFTHNWDDTAVTSADFNDLKYTNASGDRLSIERFRYLVSNVILINSRNEVYEISKYQLLDVNENNTSISGIVIPEGTYSFSFRFGFSDAENTDGMYTDLNSASFNVPGMLGGGYHFMQFDGKYLDQSDQEAGFNYHAIRAVDRTDPDNLVFQDTSFLVDLGTVAIANNAEIEIKMNIAEWFKNPNTWDLNLLNTVLMPNFNAQVLMHENGKAVFSLGEIRL
jgi:hypothetical protein